MQDSSRAPDRGYIRGIVDYFHNRGSWSFYRLSPLYLIRPFYRGRKENILDYLKRGDADGFFGYLPDQKEIRDIITSGFPAVVMPVKDLVPEVPNIIDTPDLIGATGADYFLDRGYQQLAYCGSEHYWSRVRQEGFCNRLAEMQIQPHIYPLRKKSMKDRNWDLNCLEKWLSGLPKPIGVMACNDDRAFDVLQACQKGRLKVPDEIAVLGIDNDEMVCNLVSPPLSSIDLNFEKAGYEAAKLLHKMIQKKQKRDDIIMLKPTGIITRQSTDVFAIEDPEVVKAVRFIKQNAKRNIQVKDVVESVSISLRSLQQRFRNIIGRSIHDEIRYTRINQVAELLLKTNLTIQQIAQELDYHDIIHIARAFRKEKGMSPSEFRKIHKHN